MRDRCAQPRSEEDHEGEDEAWRQGQPSFMTLQMGFVTRADHVPRCFSITAIPKHLVRIALLLGRFEKLKGIIRSVRTSRSRSGRIPRLFVPWVS